MSEKRPEARRLWIILLLIMVAILAIHTVGSCGASSPEARRLPPDLVEVADAQYALLDGLAPGSKEAQDRQRETVQQLGLPLEVKSAKTGIVFRLIPSGTFTMGSPSNESMHRSDETQHQVTLTKAFYCGKFEVTQMQWEAVMGSNPSHFTSAGRDAPVESVSWDDCQAYLKKLCRTEGTPAGTYRLLTEAEWEYACRAGTTTPFCYGDNFDSSMANFDGNYPYGNSNAREYRQTTMQVGSFQPNAWGLYDMHGNVWEPCQDLYVPFSSGNVTDPLGAQGIFQGIFPVFRGGGWNDRALRCRATFRARAEPGLRSDHFGLRIARTTPSKTRR